MGLDLRRNRDFALALAVGVFFVLLCFLPGLDNSIASDDFCWVFDTAQTIRHPGHFFIVYNLWLRHTEALYFLVSAVALGMRSFSFQLVALLLHLAGFALVALLIAEVTRSRASALVGALFWALNYKHCEVVFRPYAVADSLALVFGLAAFLLVLRGRPWLAVVPFVVALFGKNNAVVFPALLGLFIVLLVDRDPRRRRLLDTAPLWVVAALFLGAERVVAGSTAYLAVDGRAFSRFWELLLTYVGPDAVYLRMTMLHPQATLLPAWLAIGLLPALALAIWKLPSVYRFGALWTLVSMLPTLFVPFQTSRYHYLPLVGLAIIVGHGLVEAVSCLERRGSRPGVVAVVGGAALVGFYLILGVNLEERDYALMGEIHRRAVESFQESILPSLPSDAMVVFEHGDNRVWLEELYGQNLARPWYLPVTYKWVYRRPLGVLGLSDTYGFVTFSAYGRVPYPLFVAVGREEFRRRIAAGDFVVVVHDPRTNTFHFGGDDLKARISAQSERQDLYQILQPGRFDPTATGTPSLQ